MKTKLLAAVLIWFCGFGNTVFAQKENYVWYFGNHAGVDFNSGNPVALTNGMLVASEGCSSISDANGNILFYTNGITVWDKNHNQMPNGDSLNAGWSSTQAALIVPMPGNNTLYYIFTVQDESFLIHSFCYSIVDISLNGGNGDVTVKNNFITAPVTEKLTAVRHANSSDIWVMVHGLNNNNFFCYKISSAGLLTTPVLSSIGPVIPNPPLGDIRGYMKFSADGTKIAFTGYQTGYVDLFDFNSTTGIVSNEKYLTIPLPYSNYGVYGLEFSQSGNYLYATTFTAGALFQWNISSNSAPVINASIQQISITNGSVFGALQLGIDGKIYRADDGPNSVGVIHYPDSSGTSCNYSDSAVLLLNGYCYLGLPNFITSYFLPTGINTNNPQQNQLTISPNPATDKITISFAATTSENISVKIYSITGEVVFEENKKSTAPISTFQFPISNFQNGIYFLSLQTDGEVMTKKIVVNH